MSELVPLTQEQARFAERGLSVVETLARVFARQWRTIPLTDFTSTGHEAVVRAATRFDPNVGVTFEQFARQSIWGAMLDLAHREKFLVQRTAQTIARAMQESPDLEQSTDAWLEESPTPARDEVIGQLRQRAADLVAAAFSPGTRALSSQEELYIEEEERRRTLLRLRAGLATLTDPERAFVHAYYEDEETLETIAARMGVVKRTVQRMHDRIKARLAEALRDERNG